MSQNNQNIEEKEEYEIIISEKQMREVKIIE